MMGSSRPKYVSSVRGILARFLFADRSFTSSKHRAGFTLVEVVASLLIVGILGAIAGMGLVTGLRGYMQAKENGHLAQKAQIAMARIKRELMVITDVIKVSNGTDPLIIFDNPEGRQALCEFGKTLQLCELESTITDFECVSCGTLIDQIDQEKPEENFKIEYFKGLKEWDLGNDIDSLSTIKVTFVLRREEGRPGKDGTVPFETTVSLRNNKNAGGAAITDDDVTRAAGRYDCFITTAGGGSFCMKTISAKRGFIAAGLIGIFGIVSALGCVRNRRGPKRPVGGSSIRGESGNVLVALVVILLLFAALGAGMVSLIGTSSTSQVTGNTAVRAYYIAESGFRYAASRYLNTTDTNNICQSQDEKNQTLADLHDDLFTLGGGDDGQFRLKIFPYFLSVNGDTPVGSSTLATQFSGGKPEGFSLPSNGVNARIKIGNNVYFYSFYNDSSGQLTLSTPLAEDACDNAVVKLIGLPAGSAIMTNNGDLTLADGGFFPKVQGRFKIAGKAYGYTSRDGNVLQNIIDVDNPDTPINESVDSTTEVVLEPFVQVRSIGMVGQGDLAATREVVYNVPIPAERPNTITKEVFYDEFNNDTNWQSPAIGDFEVQTFEGDKALAVTGTQSGISSPKAALIPFNWTTIRANFASAHKSAGRFLSYDAQVKILFDSLLSPGSWDDGNELGTAPDGLPKYFMAGIAFRLQENLNTYGLSLARGSVNTSPTPDNIAQELMPQDQTPMLVLWQNIAGETPPANWLAYGVLPGSIIFTDDMESGTNGWTKNTAAGNEWTLVEYAEDSILKNSGTHSWTTSPSGTYGDGDDLFLESRRFDLSGFDSAILTFWTRYQINSCSDFGYVEVSTDDGATWNDRLNDRISSQCGGAETNASSYAHYTGNSENLSGNRDGWVKKTLDLGIILDLEEPTTNLENVRIRFYFNRNNGDANGDGWWVDDVKVTAKEFLDLPSKQATVMVRVFEAVVVPFNSSSTTEIKAGDLVSQIDGTTGELITGVVIVKPILASGSWAGGDAKGMLWLNKISQSSFKTGSLYLNSEIVATVTDDPKRENLIKAYYNNLVKTGEPGDLYDNPYDQIRLAEGRGEFRWPADEGFPTDDKNDYFTMIEWDIDINRNVPSPVQRLKDEEGKYTIIATDSLSTPADTYFPTPLIRPEIGLQAFGHGAADLYFDDFGLQVYFISGSGFLQPIQQ